MKHKLTTALMTCALILVGSGIAQASDDLGNALMHAGMAVAHGEDGHAKVLAEHAEEALKDTKAAEKNAKGEKKEHLSKAIEHLELGIKKGKEGNADSGAQHINEAIKHLQAAAESDHGGGEHGQHGSGNGSSGGYGH